MNFDDRTRKRYYQDKILYLLLLGVGATGRREEPTLPAGELVRARVAVCDDLVHRRYILGVIHHCQALVVTLRAVGNYQAIKPQTSKERPILATFLKSHPMN